MSLSINELKACITKILTEYSKLLKNKIEFEKARKSIGFQISSLKQYEIDDAVYPERSITVLPKCSKLLDLFLIYNSEIGRIELEVTIRAVGEKYRVSKCEIHKYDEDNINLNADIGLTIDTSLLSKVEDAKKLNDEKSNRKVPKRIENVKSSKSMICLTKDRNCCYLNKHHDPKKCVNCCFDEPHSEV